MAKVEIIQTAYTVKLELTQVEAELVAGLLGRCNGANVSGNVYEALIDAGVVPPEELGYLPYIDLLGLDLPRRYKVGLV